MQEYLAHYCTSINQIRLKMVVSAIVEYGESEIICEKGARPFEYSTRLIEHGSIREQKFIYSKTG